VGEPAVAEAQIHAPPWPSTAISIFQIEVGGDSASNGTGTGCNRSGERLATLAITCFIVSEPAPAQPQHGGDGLATPTGDLLFLCACGPHGGDSVGHLEGLHLGQLGLRNSSLIQGLADSIGPLIIGLHLPGSRPSLVLNGRA